jgi:hypothetical protein
MQDLSSICNEQGFFGCAIPIGPDRAPSIVSKNVEKTPYSGNALRFLALLCRHHQEYLHDLLPAASLVHYSLRQDGEPQRNP